MAMIMMTEQPNNVSVQDASDTTFMQLLQFWPLKKVMPIQKGNGQHMPEGSVAVVCKSVSRGPCYCPCFFVRAIVCVCGERQWNHRKTCPSQFLIDSVSLECLSS